MSVYVARDGKHYDGRDHDDLDKAWAEVERLRHNFPPANRWSIEVGEEHVYQLNARLWLVRAIDARGKDDARSQACWVEWARASRGYSAARKAKGRVGP